MERPKQQALVFLLGALLVGGVVGFASDRLMHKEDSSLAAKRKALYDDLDLEPTQRTAMDSLFDARNCQFDAAVKPIQPTLDSIKAATRAQINVILTPKQRERIDARRKDDEARHAAERDRIKTVCH
jgi:Spy/CpxP family protein refolding chaperone